jgi:hypothetical protein
VRLTDTRTNRFSDGGAPMETPDLSTLSDNIDSTDDLLPSLQVSLLRKTRTFASRHDVHVIVGSLMCLLLF